MAQKVEKKYEIDGGVNEKQIIKKNTKTQRIILIKRFANLMVRTLQTFCQIFTTKHNKNDLTR